MAPPEGPKSGCRNEVPACIEASHAALRLFTGSLDTSACQTLFLGKTGQLGAPGGGTAGEGCAGHRPAHTRTTTSNPVRRIPPEVSARPETVMRRGLTGPGAPRPGRGQKPRDWPPAAGPRPAGDPRRGGP